MNSIFVIRVETVVTASGAGRSDDEVEDGSIVAVAETLPKATQEIDAFRLLVMVIVAAVDRVRRYDRHQIRVD